MDTESRIYQAYYTKSNSIVEYMVHLLNLKGNELILEPSAGDGVFVDEIIKKYKDVKIDVFELNDKSYTELTLKYSNNQNINIKKTDTLTDLDLEFASFMGGAI